MPRARKTQSGAPAQKIASVPGQRYGEGVAQQAMQRAMPAPDLAKQTSQAIAQRANPQPTPEVQAPNPADAYASTLAAARETAGAGLLAQPTQRPGEPVTAGMVQGPGPGPEVLQPMGRTPTGQFFVQIARITGNPYYEDLARRAGL